MIAPRDLHDIFHYLFDPAFLVVMWKLVRILAVFRDHPPHSHVNGKILYAPGFEPGKKEVLGAKPS